MLIMAMPRNVAISDQMKFPTGGRVAGGGGEILHHRQWVPDERDGFISWLRGEFAAANAIIDLLCHHLRLIGEPGEYDGVIGCIQQRRCNWNSVLHMQQYFSVAEVIYALQQVTWTRQQRFFDPVKGKGFKRSSVWSRQGQRVEAVKEGQKIGAECRSPDASASANSVTSEQGEGVIENGDETRLASEIANSTDKGVALSEEKKDMDTKPSEESVVNSFGDLKGFMSGNSEHVTEAVDDGCASDSRGSCNVHLDNDSYSIQIRPENQNLTIISKTFVGIEMFDGKAVNVVDGMKLYEKLFDDSEVSKLVTLVTDLRAAGRRGQLQGQTFIVSRRPMRGHGREMIQLGLPIADAPLEDEVAAGTSKDRRIEPIPGLLQDVIEHLIAMQAVAVKPDSCVVDIFNEDDHSQPHMWPHWYGRPVCVLFLTECDMTFGKAIVVDHPGDYRGSLKLSFAPGSMLVMEGRSTDFCKHAIPSLRKQRILVTLIKSQPKRSYSDGQRPPPPAISPASHWVPPASRSSNHIRHPGGSKHYGPVPMTGVLPAPAARPQLRPPNGIQPIFVPAPIAPAMPFPAPVALPPASAGWTTAPPRHPPPRLPVPGTGVFLPPPGSGNSTTQQLSSTETYPVETPSLSVKGSDSETSNGDSVASPKGKVDEKVQRQECNASMDGISLGAVTCEEQQQVLT